MKTKPASVLGAVAISMALAAVLLGAYSSDAPDSGLSLSSGHDLAGTKQNDQVERFPEAMAGSTTLPGNPDQPGTRSRLDEQQVATPENSSGLAPRPVYDYQRPEEISEGLKALIQQVHAPIDHLDKIQRQHRVEQILEQLPYHVTSGEVHPQEATLLHMHLLQNELGMDEEQLLTQVEEVANLYKSMSPLEVIGYQ